MQQKLKWFHESKFPEQAAETLWQEVLEHLRLRVPASAYATWFQKTQGRHLDAEHLVVWVPDDFHAEWIEAHYRTLVQETLREMGFPQLRVLFHPPASPDPTGSAPSESLRQAGLNPRYSFENFLVGPHNEFAYAAARRFSQEKWKRFNPLFIHGKSGLGKTHLLQAIGLFVKANYPDLHVHYLTAEAFMTGLIQSLQGNQLHLFKKRIREVDLLLVDDLHLLSNKEIFKRELFLLLNYLLETGRGVAMASALPPSEIPSLDGSLLSRVHGGLVLEIRPPDRETRLAILRKKAAEMEIVLPEDVAQLIAQRVRGNIRELEGCLNRIAAYMALKGHPIDLPTANEILKDVLLNQPPVTFDQILQAVAEVFGITPQEILGASRKKRIAQARRAAMILTREFLGLPVKAIASLFHRKSHSTILHSLEEGYRELSRDLTFRGQYLEVRRRLEG